MKRFLFLQGPQGPFFHELGDALQRAGHVVHRVNFHGGDVHDWPRGTAYRGRMTDWPAAVQSMMGRHRIDSLVLYGDCRPIHRAAIDTARIFGAAVHVFEEAYFRPGYMTLERGGVNGHSALPRDPGTIRRAAARIETVPPPVTGTQPRAGEAVRYYTRAHVSKVALQFPHVRWHRGAAPLTEGLGYVKRHLLRSREEQQTAKAQAGVAGRRHFLLPLQLDCDFQLRSHSEEGSMQAALRAILTSFAASAPADTHLLVKRHPLDNGLVNWRALCAAPRVHFSPGGDLHQMLGHTVGMVTVNSTAALPALERGIPVKALGRAIYNVPGLTDGKPLADFWHRPSAPDSALFDDFRALVVAKAQIPGDPGCAKGRAALIAAAMPQLTGGYADPLARAA
ncbi:capsule biosynthesis protein [Pacificimonas flava]|uniref:Capsular polysaccharide export system protein KpsS n=1 Tax=Pacificimonas flava TaxID=1234595 RepID=M2S9B0_9SPHN|nr:capsular biosynthesis protein [Pacificimonas flava]EMD81965.1 Capsular polysaccharide export system protein KpsS [Pacificimonas flava]MBB5280471.1 capsular polysaccharide export protein [Pacificimonas flava]